MKYIAIHHSAVKTTTPQLYAINRYHRDKNWGTNDNPWYQSEPSSLGWYVGYNMLIDIDGTVTNCREVGTETIAVKGHNCDVPERCDTISICIAGNFNKELLLGSRYESLKKVILDIKKKYPDIKVVGHRDLDTRRTCPGEYLDEDEMGALNELSVDLNDEAKAREIKRLTSMIDVLMAWVAKLLAKRK